MIKIKRYACNICGRPIKHKGNCLKCNLILKRDKKKKVDVMIPGFGSVDILISQILKTKSVDHKEIQLQLRDIFRNSGYFVELEKKIQAKRLGRIDLFATKHNFSFGIEIDHSLIRFKSIDKLNTLKPSLAIFILKSKNVNKVKVKSRLSLIKVKSIIISFIEGKTQNLN